MAKSKTGRRVKKSKRSHAIDDDNPPLDTEMLARMRPAREVVPGIVKAAAKIDQMKKGKAVGHSSNGLAALRKSSLKGEPILLLAAEHYLEKYEAGSKMIGFRGCSLHPRTVYNSPHLRGELEQAGAANLLDGLVEFTRARSAMHFRYAWAVDACLIDLQPLPKIGRKLLALTQVNGTSAAAVTAISFGLADLAKHFKLMGGRG